jgi:hypothetical protein
MNEERHGMAVYGARIGRHEMRPVGGVGSHSLSCVPDVTAVSISNTLICIHMASTCCTVAYRNTTGPFQICLLLYIREVSFKNGLR